LASGKATIKPKMTRNFAAMSTMGRRTPSGDSSSPPAESPDPDMIEDASDAGCPADNHAHSYFEDVSDEDNNPRTDEDSEPRLIISE